MNQEIIKGSWSELVGQIKTRWGKLTNDQIKQSEGDVYKLKGELQKTYGYSKDEAKREWEDFWHSRQ